MARRSPPRPAARGGPGGRGGDAGGPDLEARIRDTYVREAERIDPGIRACLAKEFTEVWCLDLSGGRGPVGLFTGSEAEVVGPGFGAPTAVTFLVRNPRKSGCAVRYSDVGDRPGAKPVLDAVRLCGAIAGVRGCRIVEPGGSHEWVDGRDDAEGIGRPGSGSGGGSGGGTAIGGGLDEFM